MEITLEALVELVGGKLMRSGRFSSFTNIAALNEALNTDISFLGNPLYYQDFLKTQAGAVLVPPQVPEHDLPDSTLILVDNPSSSFAKVVAYFRALEEIPHPGIHPTASIGHGCQLDPNSVAIGPNVVVGNGCVIGAGSDIRAGAVLGDGVKIGENSRIYPNVVIRERCLIGSRVILQPGCIIGSDGFGYDTQNGVHHKIEQVGIVVIEDDVEIGANTTIDRARFGRTVVGKGTKIDNLVQLGHNVTIGHHSLVVAQVGIAGSTHLGNHVIIAAQTGIAGHLKLDDHVTVAARAGVTTHLSAGTYWGMPASPIRDVKKQMIVTQQLPELLKRIKKLEKEVASLRSDASESAL